MGHIVRYSEKYDASYCITCDTWLESGCGDPGCDFCIDRPDPPSLATDPDNRESIGTKCPKEDELG